MSSPAPVVVSDAPRSVAVCICTYERPLGLARCLASLERLETPGIADDAIRIVVVDNAAGGSAEGLVAAHATRSRYRVTYVHERAKGLTRARNAALAAVRAGGEDALAFIDDDEAAVPGWLAALRDAMVRTGAPAAVGPVYPVFEERPPEWAVRGGFFALVDPPGARFAEEGRSGNVMMSCAELARAGVAFDTAFNELGGEDTAFFRALRARGWRLAVAHEAIIHEWVPPRRVAVAWLAQRWYRTGAVEARTQRRAYNTGSGRATALARGLVRLGAGGVLAAGSALAFGWRDASRPLRRLSTLARGGGLVASAFGYERREYARPQVEARQETRPETRPELRP
ncbi:glycosyltransferase family 2 protein [Salinarimonas rosea]|uniref:glycosyltransferase family 2 protein n=1 Tax=Salinarimonas rosea TaxID=552063 RepID=UPI00040E9ED0|nr:glycosyltransferase family 2 protein [Salinarimonas rosea]